MLEEHVEQLHKLSAYLIEFEKIDAEDFDKFMKGEFTIETKREASGEIGKKLDVVAGDNGAETENKPEPAEVKEEPKEAEKADENKSDDNADKNSDSSTDTETKTKE